MVIGLLRPPCMSGGNASRRAWFQLGFLAHHALRPRCYGHLRDIEQQRYTAGSALRAHQPTSETREREVGPAGPHKGLHVQLRPLSALAYRLHAVPIAKGTAGREP